MGIRRSIIHHPSEIWSNCWRAFLAMLWVTGALAGSLAQAQNIRDVDTGHASAYSSVDLSSSSASCPSCPSSGIGFNSCSDTKFVTSCGGGLDTGCTYRDGGPLVIRLPVTRAVGDLNALKRNGLISTKARLLMPAYDIDFYGGGGYYNPERDRVLFNGRVVPGEYLQGDDGIWRLNEFEVPIEWVKFPEVAESGAVTPAENIIQIEIDTANSEYVWCMSIDWVKLEIDVVRPVVMAHGILSKGKTWDQLEFSWVKKLDELGIPNSNKLNMGDLDSIGNNAQKISAEINAAKQKWGVDKVNIVAHSKGGLDSREYVEGSDTVEKLIQLGTPNAGSPLADKVQELLIRGGARFGVIGALAPVLIETFAAPAAIQLTTPYMALYNGTHGSNPQVSYTALAGDYDPDCLVCRPLDRLLLLLTGQGDTIVPISSVHALPYTENRIFSSSGANKQATHTGLTSASGVFDAVRNRVLDVRRRSLGMESLAPAIAHTGSEVNAISQGEMMSQVIVVDQATPATFTLLYPSGNLDLTLISPSGQRFDPGTIAGNPNVTHEEGQYIGGVMEVYRFTAPEIGTWTAEVRAVSVTEPSGKMGYAVAASIEQPAITLKGALAQPSRHLNEPLQLLGTLKNNGAPVTGAEVTAFVGLPAGTVVPVTLRDDGLGGDAMPSDGVYTASFTNTSQPGNYRILFAASRPASQGLPALTREAFALATISRSTSSIVGPFQEYGQTTDLDNLFNQLVYKVGVNVTQAGQYSLLGILTDSQGNTISARAVESLSAGTNTMTLLFDGETIFNNGVNGPYALSVLRLSEEAGMEILPVDERTSASETRAYSYLQFQHKPVFLTGNGTATGVDLNNNSLFDWLYVDVEAYVPSYGYYQWSARLVDRHGKELGFSTSGRYLNPGMNLIRLAYAGEPIGVNGVDGPYVVKSLLLFGGGASLIEPVAFTTGVFRASQFEGYVVDNIPPTLQVQVSPSVLWPVDHKLVAIRAAITVTDNVDPNPTVELLSITSNELDDGTGDGHTSGDIQGAAFGTDDREFSLRAERSGRSSSRVYTITYRARDAAGNASTATATVTVPHDRR